MLSKLIIAKSWVAMCYLSFLLRLSLVGGNGARICDPTMKARLLNSPPSEEWDRGQDLNRQSLSAWTWKRTFVRNGIPEVIYEAVCDSAYCDYPHSDSEANDSLNAVPIYQVVLVLQRQQGKRRCYTAGFRRVAVGCTCMWAKTE